MPKVKWIGLIRQELSNYQKGKLSKNAKKMKMPKTANEMMVKAIPLLILPFCIIFLSMFFKTLTSKQVVVTPIFICIGFFIGFVALLIHEYLHAIIYPKDATVYIGFYPKALAMVALASYPLKRERFILMSLLPTILGIIPIIIFMITPPSMKGLNGFLFGLSIMGLTSPYPDFYNVYQVLKQTPKKCRIQFYEDDTYWID